MIEHCEYIEVPPPATLEPESQKIRAICFTSKCNDRTLEVLRELRVSLNE